MRYAARKDDTQEAIVQALRAIGVQVQVVSSDGAPDLSTKFRGRWLPIEVKSKGGKLTKSQRPLHDETQFPSV